MTNPREPVHRDGCDRAMKPAERVGGWLIARCRSCAAVSIRRAERAAAR